MLLFISRLAKPLHRLLTKLIDDTDVLAGYNSFIRDAMDNVEELQDDFGALLRECEVLDDEFERFHQRRMDRTMYALTVVTCIFLPMQFMTGVYGMNFHNIPEERNPLAYATFWLCTGLYLALFAIVLGLRECWRRCPGRNSPKRPKRPTKWADRNPDDSLNASSHPTRAGGFLRRFLPSHPCDKHRRLLNGGLGRRLDGDHRDGDLESALLPRHQGDPAGDDAVETPRRGAHRSPPPLTVV